jgi:hypothetical protein
MPRVVNARTEKKTLFLITIFWMLAERHIERYVYYGVNMFRKYSRTGYSLALPGFELKTLAHGE